jgi:hypothetical protein
MKSCMEVMTLKMTWSPLLNAVASTTPKVLPGSSVSVVSGYGLGDRGSVPGRGKRDFSSKLCVQGGSRAHPASCTVGTGGTFPGCNARPGRDADDSPPSSAEVVNE